MWRAVASGDCSLRPVDTFDDAVEVSQGCHPVSNGTLEFVYTSRPGFAPA